MKKTARAILLLLFPFVLMIIVNESVRAKLPSRPKQTTSINGSNKDTERCTWACHNDTQYCKQHHVKFLGSSFNYTDKFYFGFIHILRQTGNYIFANIVFLVVLIPLMIWFFLIRSFNMQDEINKLKRK